MVLDFGCILAFKSADAWVSFPDTDLIGLGWAVFSDTLKALPGSSIWEFTEGHFSWFANGFQDVFILKKKFNLINKFSIDSFGSFKCSEF